jgi:catechol 2,3-dioxygenase-like lactoylglutathione lyase family enzyme
MAIGTAADTQKLRLLSFRLCSANAERLAGFYEKALGFRRVAPQHLSGTRSDDASLSVGGRMRRITLKLGQQRIELIQFVDHPGRSYPTDSRSSDLVFQHFAIVVVDMDAAMQHLSTTDGWTPISIDGPQHLPESSGGVTSFKFRDPEGHPLELLAFPPGDVPEYWQSKAGRGPFLGIDHSAISISDTARSIAFYESLGLSVNSRSLNEGPTQARLDHLDQPVVEVTAMQAAISTPHLELLCYRQGEDRTALDLRANDVAATCVVFWTEDGPGNHGVSDAPVRQLLDPDGHHLSFVPPLG